MRRPITKMDWKVVVVCARLICACIHSDFISHLNISYTHQLVYALYDIVVFDVKFISHMCERTRHTFWILGGDVDDGVFSLLCAYSVVEASNRIVNEERKDQNKNKLNGKHTNWQQRVKWWNEWGKRAMKWKRKCIQESNGTSGKKFLSGIGECVFVLCIYFWCCLSHWR